MVEPASAPVANRRFDLMAGNRRGGRFYHCSRHLISPALFYQFRQHHFDFQTAGFSITRANLAIVRRNRAARNR